MNWDKEFYYVECHTSFTYSYGYGKITTDVDEFNVMYIKCNTYKMTIMITTIEHTDYISGWVKIEDNDYRYGAGSRFMLEGKLNECDYDYTEFFLTPTQTEREQKLKEILYER
jgi:hypothetical protein